MKTLTIFLLISISLISYGQENFNDWFDLNLKGKPKCIKEFSLMNLSNCFNPDFKEDLNKSLKWNLFIYEYYFDKKGFIIKDFYKVPTDTIGQKFDYSDMKLFQYKDSIIRILYDKDGSEALKEKRFLDSNGYIKQKIVVPLFDYPDTFIFTRDLNNRIIKEYRHWYHTDYGKKINTTYILNENNDIKLEKISTFEESFECEDDCFTYKEYWYEYIYDSKKNWIVKTTFYENEILSTEERIIEY